MGQYDFTYEIPDGFPEKLIRFLMQNKYMTLASDLKKCKLQWEDVGYAYYAGLRAGDTWNKHALDITVEGPSDNINRMRHQEKSLKEAIQNFLRPSQSGFLVRKVIYIIADDEIRIDLPKENGETFETLYRDIYDALGKNEPVLVLDRLHTYSVKYFRDICQKHCIDTSDESGNNYPLHSLVGALSKYYQENNTFESEFACTAIKMSVSVFDKFNAIRNNQSYAHDNAVLSKAEAEYVVTIVAATLKFVREIEKD